MPPASFVFQIPVVLRPAFLARVADFSSFFFPFEQTCGPIVVVWASLHKKNMESYSHILIFCRTDSQGNL